MTETMTVAASRWPDGYEPAATGGIRRDELLRMLDAVKLTGRGGAAFPLAAKIRALRPGAAPVVVANGCEGEPASWKDGVLLNQTPHRVLNGLSALAGAVGANRTIVAVTSPRTAQSVQRAIQARPDGARIEIRVLPDRYVTGEARALVAGLNGGLAVPPGRRELPTDHGVDGLPTLVCNVETLAQLATLLAVGPSGYRSAGTDTQPGTTLVTVSGAVDRAGVYEVPFGTSMGDLARLSGATDCQAFVVGGYHGTWLPPDESIELSSDGLARYGGRLGAGALIFVGSDTCALSELARVTGWLATQSAGQCGPCAFGLPAIAQGVGALVQPRGVARGARSAALPAGTTAPVAIVDRQAASIVGRGACAHPDGVSAFVRSGLRLLAPDVEVHRTHGGCGRADRGYLTTVIGGPQ
jgi:NADH:ubiquinone oxidoreductase subunit F (NADH-binding)